MQTTRSFWYRVAPQEIPSAREIAKTCVLRQRREQTRENERKGDRAFTLRKRASSFFPSSFLARFLCSSFPSVPTVLSLLCCLCSLPFVACSLFFSVCLEGPAAAQCRQERESEERKNNMPVLNCPFLPIFRHKDTPHLLLSAVVHSSSHELV
ncbi:hypothetical protein TGRUB_267610 [Toxoplasma gondii RUB]|uniref:Uncharacterized protein n=7 Tax=Toxoplasma gondii TaxID=5811 RepID=S7UHV4_TOXGG|nr:hypothetical protein TGGT1_267610 [Toxoplasma gondii GT1]KAF4644052.1 hypothetical protein TGRH88_010500 [Toxoplasma gondii]KFG38899.1 hypothetical protein TGDOM2_267610 [Toxoplasma gondii GAB2-2007-GAL-DOM2]KFG42767.1 hypothetical protein TGFOU_267610 [Toxoplasma gondii FOU]KFG58947.1 hypothetical protein TGRUB_267610 [Toxoplasma gondii RUB]KFH01707.1 hypothetical protein TGVAND_267610 [Toxoplasma gondii VAND]RQX74191.1 hypothetical protein TGCAST_267610 [Toxoplasma gondii CAST]